MNLNKIRIGGKKFFLALVLGVVLINFVDVACADSDSFAVNELQVSGARYIEVPIGEKSNDFESQCGGTLDFQDVESYDGTYGVLPGVVNSHEGPVGYHVQPGCSGTLISNNIFLSAGHCGYQVGDQVAFGYQRDAAGNIIGGVRFNVVQVMEQQDTATLDYAVVRLAGNPGARFGFARIGNREPSINERITIIGHPQRSPKQISTGPRIAQASGIGANWFCHQADSLGGSSGSGVIGSDGQIVGVHTNAGCRTTGNILGNHAIRMTVLLANSTALANIHRLYPRAELRNAADLCLDVHAPDILNNGGRVQVWSCNGQPQQQWKLQNGALRNIGGLCLDVHAPDIGNNGGRVQVWECNGQPQQEWFVENGGLVNAAGLCLDVHAPDIGNNGGRVQVWQCNDQPQQNWRTSPVAVTNGAGLCLDVHAPDIGNNGGKVQVWECNGQPQQQWTFENGRLVNAAGLCLDVHAPDIGNNGGKVQVWQCNGQPQQQWNIP